MGLKEDIGELGRSLGFDAVGVAPARRPPAGDAFLRWLDAGHHGEMEYMAAAPERRADPTVYWPAARSIVVCARSYAPGPADDPAPGPLEGTIARYARGRDYHDVLKKDLLALGRGITRLWPGVTFRPVVDTAAVLERAHAVAAGLGWIGKNTMLLSRSLGSYTLLGAVLLDRELAEDAPVSDHCGSCRRCLDACPTGALLSPGVLDARRCLSYLTIEARGDVPEVMRAAAGAWTFGCDICQEVCPWVAKAGPARSLGRLAPVPGRSTPALGALLGLDTEGFAAFTQASPLKRAKLGGLKRNAAVNLGNSPDRDGAVEIGAAALAAEADPMVRRHLGWALGRLGGRASRRALEAALAAEGDVPTREALDDALGHLP